MMHNQEELVSTPSTVQKPFMLRLRFSQQLNELRKLSKEDLLTDKALPILESCWQFVQKAFPVEQPELHRKIAYSLFNNSAIPATFLMLDHGLKVLRVLIFSKSRFDVTTFKAVKAVVLNAIEDMKIAIKKSQDDPTILNNNAKPCDYENPKKLKEITVSFGTGEDFLMDLLRGDRLGYSLEQSAVRGIFVSPHDGTQALERIEHRTGLYACYKPFRRFDKPASISFTIATDKLHHINYNAHEVVILAEDLKLIPRNLKMLRYDPSLGFEQEPAIIDSKPFAQEVVNRYGQEIGGIILDAIKSQQDCIPSEPEAISLSIGQSYAP